MGVAEARRIMFSDGADRLECVGRSRTTGVDPIALAHELGHVFRLVHVEDPEGLMTLELNATGTFLAVAECDHAGEQLERFNEE
jgi:hypothetical protein